MGNDFSAHVTTLLVVCELEGLMSIERLNAFCRKYDLVFKEMGRVKGEEVYWFIDFENNARYYSAAEITDKMNMDLVAH
jgi:hypothetical protein